MLTFILAVNGYQIYDGAALVLDQPGDPRLPCVEPMVLAPFASDADAQAHAEQAIGAMSPPATPAGLGGAL